MRPGRPWMPGLAHGRAHAARLRSFKVQVACAMAHSRFEEMLARVGPADRACVPGIVAAVHLLPGYASLCTWNA